MTDELRTTDIQHRVKVQTREEPGMALGESHYVRIQRKIKTSVTPTTASLWLAAAFTFFGAGVGGLITLLALPVAETSEAESARGQLEVALVACAVLTIVCVLAHLGWYRDHKSAGEDICDEMDTYSQRRER